MKKYREKNKNTLKEKKKKYYDKNKEQIIQSSKEYYEKNKEKRKEYRQTEQGKKSRRIVNWKRQEIIFHDWDLLNEIYLQTTHCDECNCLLNTNTYTRKCVDHDHSITNDDNVRNILCHICNIKRR